ncbi:MAG: tRNA pseudouridine(55) synthase TruB [Elusimicrobia bacterium RIFCSPLOWO2_12_FULL_59_9]|nr:MAG: tRNA pseudouridine(55) synthase TruB [Elusimicrobia bacterium RIFCSPLOWO2_12_FULL_59_9]
MTPPPPALSGLLLVDKPPGLTSHDVVLHVRRRLPPALRVGHSGTLDPLATGLLVVLIGSATKSQAQFQMLHKEYEGEILLGLSTDTGDVSGKPTATTLTAPMPLPLIESCLAAHRGKISQVVPKYSASKYKGKPFYRYARQGIETPQRVRPVTIFRFDCLQYRHPVIEFRLACSSGTYVRSLAEAVGARLGCGATMQSLRRMRVGSLRVADAMSHGELLTAPRERLLSRIMPLSLDALALPAPEAGP